MKKLVILVFVVFGLFITVYGQDMDYSFDTSQLKTPRQELNFFQDTLWVMDSSNSFQLISGELEFVGNYIVLTRDGLGNKLIGIGKYKYNLSEPLEKLSLDSMFYFNGTNDVEYSKSFSWNSNDDKWMKHMYSLFDEDGNILEHYVKNWNNYLNEYTYGSQSIAEYEDTLLIISTRNNYNPETDDWAHYAKNEFFYNDAGLDTLQIVSSWDTIHQKWMNQLKYQYLLTEDGNINELLGYTWNEDLGIWIFSYKQIFKMNNQGLTDTTLLLTWDTLQNNWVPQFRNSYFYNELGKESSHLTEINNLQDDSWENQYLFKYEHVTQKNITTFSIWDTINNIWQFYRRDSYSYIAENILDTAQFEEWDTLTQQWKGYHRLINSFDSHMNQTGSLEQYWDDISGNWTDGVYEQYFWSPFNPLDILELNTERFSIYPNPANTMVKVTMSELAQGNMLVLYNTSGQEVKKLLLKPYKYEYEFTVSGLPAGMYVVVLYDNGKIIGKEKVLISR